jgi:ketosteroid isomerase-like protein
MPEQTPTPDLAELTRHVFATAGHRDIEANMRFHAEDAQWDLSDAGFGTFKGVAAIRAFLNDWFTSYESYENDVQEIAELGNGVIFLDVHDTGRLAGIGRSIEQRRGWVVLWVDGKVARVAVYLDVDKGRAAAERLAESRE